MLKIETFVFNPFAENTFLIWDDKSSKAMIIDPGCMVIEEEDELNSFINDNSLKLETFVNTHCHIDHIFGNAFVKETYNAQFIAPEKDLPLIDQFLQQAEAFGLEAKPSPKPDKFFDENESIYLGEIECKPIFTPGHTPGEFCLYFPSEKVCFTGDVLFKESIGRTDLWGGNFDTLINSVKSKLITLPEDVTIYPGHGDSSTIGYEKENNSFL